MHDTSELDSQENHQIRHHFSQIKTTLSDKSHRLADKINSWTLFAKITIWVLLALITFIMLSLGLSGKVWGIKLIEYLGIGAKPYQKTTIALTLVGGIGAVGYLVIKYQERTSAQRAEQRAIEKQETEDLLAAIHLLGDDKPSTRIAGVQSLVAIGQNHPETRQRIVDILCGYLRTDRGEKDGPVESTILKTLQAHLISPHDTFQRDRWYKLTRFHPLTNSQISDPNTQDLYWSSIDIDLHDSTFTEEVNFNYIKCGSFDMRNVKIRSAEGASFRFAIFEKPSYFSRIECMGGGRLNFIGTQFKDLADFSYSNLHGARFYKTNIAVANFVKSNLTFAYFDGAHICNTVFIRSILDHAQFHRARLDNVNFKGGSFFKPSFRASSFTNAYFDYTTLVNADFSSTRINDTRFSRAKFEDTSFRNARLNNTDFSHSNFDNIDFKRTKFAKGTTFQTVKFNENADFKNSLIGNSLSTDEEENLSIIESCFFCIPDFADINCYTPIKFDHTHFLKTSPSLTVMSSTIKTTGKLLFDLNPTRSKQSSITAKKK